MLFKVWAPGMPKLASVCGNISSDEAKIGGITPDAFTRNGKWEVCPPYIFLPTIRLAYWIGIRL